MNVVVLSPHPDDETLGAGGTLLKYKKQGHKIYWINVTDASDENRWPKEFLAHRAEMIAAVTKYYGFDGVYNLKFEPCGLGDGNRNELIGAIAKCFDEIQPEVVLLPNPYDAHSDHKAVFEAAMSCTKVFRHPYVKRILTMEILSETDFGSSYEPFVADYFVDISDTMDGKIEAMKLYDTEVGEAPFPRNLDAIRSLAQVRGGTAGVLYAEAFHLIKMIES